MLSVSNILANMFDTIKEISKLGDKLIKLLKTEEEGKIKKDSTQRLLENIECSNTYIIGIPLGIGKIKSS